MVEAAVAVVVVLMRKVVAGQWWWAGGVKAGVQMRVKAWSKGCRVRWLRYWRTSDMNYPRSGTP